MPNSGEFGVPKNHWKLWMHQIGTGKNSTSLPGPLSVTMRWCHPQEVDGDPCAGYPRACLSIVLAPGRHPHGCTALCQLGPDPVLAAKAQRFPSPGEELGKDPMAQVRQCSCARGPTGQPLPRIDFPVNSPLLGKRIHSTSLASSQLGAAFWVKSSGLGFGLPTMSTALP